MSQLQKESIFVPIGSTDRLHIRRFSRSLSNNSESIPVLMVHGSIENGRIFYSESEKGFACFLAREGFDVYVADLRGRGQSSPAISASSIYGQNESITEEIPAFVDAIRARRGDIPQVWVGHSWGGVLLLSSFARVEKLRKHVRAMVFFGTKRTVQVQNLEKWLKIDFFWNCFARLLVWKYGYLPTKQWGIGADNESSQSHFQSVRWVKPGFWIDPVDGFDYGQALQNAALPPALYLAGTKDYCLGHPHDVKYLIQETGSPLAEYRELGGYGHIDMLTSPNALKDHFHEVADWMIKKFKLSPSD